MEDVKTEARIDVDLRAESLDALVDFLECNESNIANKENDLEDLAGVFFDVMDRDAKCHITG